MRNVFSRSFALLAALISIPFIYNSCQGGLIGMGSMASSKKICKTTLIDGKVQSTMIDPLQPPEPFAAGKVRLDDTSFVNGKNGLAHKTSSSAWLSEGTKLGVILNNLCLRDNSHSLSETVITKAASATAVPIEDMDQQAYLWELDRDYTVQEIEDLAAQEICVTGVSWNHEYKLQAAPVNDSGIYDQLSYLNAIRAIEAWDLFYGSAGGMSLTATPDKLVKIAVIDTGVDWSHVDLKSQIWEHSYGKGIDITTYCPSGCVVNYNPNDVSSIGHGTHVAGLIAAAINNTGTVGVMPYRAQIMAIKMFALDADGALTTNSTHFYNAVRFAYKNNAHVINLSLGSIKNSSATDALAEAAVDEAVANKAVVITVIGNADGSSAGAEVNNVTLSSIPGQYASRAGVIGVGSFDTLTGDKSAFSHYSRTYAEIGAPGAERSSIGGVNTTGIWSTKPGGYGRLAGTSQAAPLVAAAAGLVIGMIKDKYNVVPDPAEVENLILSSAVKSPQLSNYFKDGNRLDLVKLAERIRQRYPLTAGSSSTDLSSQGCQ